MVDYWAPQGTRLQATSEDIAKIEKYLLQDSRIETIATFVGEGAPRFYLPVSPENPNAAYGQMVVNVHNVEESEGITHQLSEWLHNNIPNAMTRV